LWGMWVKTIIKAGSPIAWIGAQRASAFWFVPA
jgi:hypothetical protein